MKYEHIVISGDETSVKWENEIVQKMSNDGWELVAVLFISLMSKAVRLYFKRPIAE